MIVQSMSVIDCTFFIGAVMFRKIVTFFGKQNNKPIVHFSLPEDEALVSLIVKDDQYRYAVLYSIKHDLYMLPAGKVEPSESPIEAMIREAREELGIHITPNQLNALGYEYDTYTTDGVTKVIKVNVFELINCSEPIVNAEPHKHSTLTWMNRRQMMMTFAIQRPFSVNSISLRAESRPLDLDTMHSLVQPMSA